MKAIKVCHMTSVHPRFDTRIFLKECTSLAAYGFEVYLVSQGEGTVVKDGVICVGVGIQPESRVKRMTTFSKEVYRKALELDCDIYHFHDPELLPYALKLKKQKKVVVFDSHEIHAEQLKKRAYLPNIFSRIIACIYGRYESYIVRRIDGAITPCTNDGKHLFEGVCENTATADNYPILSEMFDKYNPEIIKYDRSICYVGSLSEDRGVTNVIKAGYNAGCTVYIGGAFESEEYKREVMNLPEFSCVKYLGILNRNDVVDLIMHCYVGMAILLNVGQYNNGDNMPTKVYEYMSLGIPVVLTEAKYNKQQIDAYDFGVCVNPENVEEITKAITYLLDNPDVAYNKGLNGRKAVKGFFNWENQSERIKDFYEKLLKSDLGTAAGGRIGED